MQYENEIPDSYRKWDECPTVETVGELIDALEKLPRDLPIFEPQSVQVTKVNDGYLALYLEEAD